MKVSIDQRSPLQVEVSFWHSAIVERVGECKPLLEVCALLGLLESDFIARWASPWIDFCEGKHL